MDAETASALVLFAEESRAALAGEDGAADERRVAPGERVRHGLVYKVRRAMRGLE